jgi:hypothetical protein
MALFLKPKRQFGWKPGEYKAAMKPVAIVALVMLGLSIPALGQDKTSCHAFFQVLQADTQTPENLRTGMDDAQKKWWENEGQKKYPGLCLNGSVMTGDKPRYLVIWSQSGSIESAAVPPGEVYGQTTSVIQSTAAKERIYRPLWSRASISILSLTSEGNLDPAPIRLTAEDRSHWFRMHNMDTSKVLDLALQYLAQDEEVDSTQTVADGQPPPPPPAPPAVGPTLTLRVSPTVIEKGQSATLIWSSTNATALNLAPAMGTVAPAGMVAVTPADTTDYTITARGPGGDATATVRITVSFFTQKPE